MKLSETQKKLLELYADLVWQKKDEMNLTSVSGRREIWDRHIEDGLAAARFIFENGAAGKTAADMGSGAGYIGITAAIALPEVKVTLVESLGKRCAFMRWAMLKTGLKNVTILNERAFDGAHAEFYDYVFERAMGKFEEVSPVCLSYVKPGGSFIAFQSAPPPGAKAVKYTLPFDGKERFLAVITKNGHN